MSRGTKIVLAASDSESTEYQSNPWRQMLLATLPASYAKHFRPDLFRKNEVAPDGRAKYVPQGLRVIESLLLRHFPPEDVAVCYTDQLELFIGHDTRAIGIHAHNPLGISFTSEGYSQFYGRTEEPLNVFEFRRLILHDGIRRHKAHLKIIVGGPGSWQLERRGMQDEYGVDCIVDGEGEEVAVQLFESALRGEVLPRKVHGRSPNLEQIPPTNHRATFGGVEITRGCGRGCQFCSVALRGGHSVPLDQILHNVRVQVAEGADTVMLTTEDLFLYEQGPKFKTNVPALKHLFEAVRGIDGVKHMILTHATLAPVVSEPHMIEDISPIALDMAVLQHPHSTHRENRYVNVLVGVETGSPRLCKQIMKGKAYPFRPEQWPEVVLNGIQTLNRNNWFPVCTFILGLPGETREDTKHTLELLSALRNANWLVLPTLFVPLEETRASKYEPSSFPELTDLQWEVFFTCWRYNMDFHVRAGGSQWKWNLGIPLYYYLLGRRLFGPRMKYPLFRLAHFPEGLLRKKLYLNLSPGAKPKLQIPRCVEIPSNRIDPVFPIFDR